MWPPEHLCRPMGGWGRVQEGGRRTTGDEHIKEAMNEKANARTGSERELSDLAALRPAWALFGRKEGRLAVVLCSDKAF